jgi:hypothetical protein
MKTQRFFVQVLILVLLLTLSKPVASSKETHIGPGQITVPTGATTQVDSFPLPIIPGSSGFGMETPAGSGRHLATPNTTVYRVTNLNDSGTGSLRYGLEEVDCPKVIIFEVSGNITLSEHIVIGGWGGNDGETKGSYITIAGQTAPSPGITIKDYGIRIERTSHDILIQHIRIRPGDITLYEGVTKEAIADCFTLVPSNAESDNIIIDHCSCSWAGDMNIQTQMSGITIQNCIISEALHNPLHPKGPHSRGLLVFAQRPEQGQNVCVTGNLFAHNMARNPSVNAGAKAVVSNNLIYNVNVQIKCDDAGKWKTFITAEKNVIKGVNRYPTARALILESRLYFGPDNLLNGESFGPDIWSNMHMPFGIVPEVCRASVPPITVPGLTLRPVEEVEEWVLSNAGARPADRDPVDIRVINDVLNGTGEIIVSQNDVGGWPILAENHCTLDLPENYNEIQPSGYTKLEEWLHGYSEEVEKKRTSSLVLHGASANQAIHLNWTIGDTLPVTSTWQLAYDGPSGDQPSPISDIISPTRAYTLTGMTNYTLYTVTLNAMLDSTPFLTDTVKVMPTDIFVYLPLVLRAYGL